MEVLYHASPDISILLGKGFDRERVPVWVSPSHNVAQNRFAERDDCICGGILEFRIPEEEFKAAIGSGLFVEGFEPQSFDMVDPEIRVVKPEGIDILNKYLYNPWR